MSEVEKENILFDGHVHIYGCFTLDVLLDAAQRNFSKAAIGLGLKGKVTGVLLLAETSHDDWFNYVRDKCKKNQQILNEDSVWEFQVTPDSDALLATKRKASQAKLGQAQKMASDDIQVYIIAGRQIITAEGLELLALATNHSFEDGLTVNAALDAVRSCDAIPVFPWAVGKWLGNRGKVLASLLSSDSKGGLFLGDNGGRPICWKNPSHFVQARALSMAILPGTDPLPFAGEAERLGSFGFAVQGALSNRQPVNDLKILLRATGTKVQVYGQCSKLWRFLYYQIRLRVA